MQVDSPYATHLQQGRECERETLQDKRTRDALFLTLAQNQGARKEKTEHISTAELSQANWGGVCNVTET